MTGSVISTFEPTFEMLCKNWLAGLSSYSVTSSVMAKSFLFSIMTNYLTVIASEFLHVFPSMPYIYKTEL